MRESVWLEIGSEDRIMTSVNMDFIQSYSVSPYANDMYRVYLFPHGEDDPFMAYQGNIEKCQKFVKELNKKIGAVKIEAMGEHRCKCECGCHAMIREDFELCDECDADLHFEDYQDHLAELELKKDAVESRGSIHTASHG